MVVTSDYLGYTTAGCPREVLFDSVNNCAAVKIVTKKRRIGTQYFNPPFLYRTNFFVSLT